MIVHGTEIESYAYKGRQYFVKREDLACTPPGPPFAKVRGLYAVMQDLKQQGVRTVGYMDTAISMAGWGIAYFAKELGMDAVIYYPRYKDGYKYNQSVFIPKWNTMGATVVALDKPQMQAINVLRAKKVFRNDYPDGVFLPNGLKLQQAVDSVAVESQLAMQTTHASSIVVSVGSGVMAAGVLKGIHGFAGITLYGVTVHDKSDVYSKRKAVFKLAGLKDYNAYVGLFDKAAIVRDDELSIIKGKYDYYVTASSPCPFPCNAYYDLKAFEWMCANLKYLSKPVLFWNVGA